MDDKKYLKVTLKIGLTALWIMSITIIIIGVVEKEILAKLTGISLSIIGGLIDAISKDRLKDGTKCQE